MTTELTVPQQIEKALAFTETKAQVLALVAESSTIIAITNGAGYQQCHAARVNLKNTRIAIQKTGKEAREDAIKFQKGVIEKEKELVSLIEPEEDRLQALQDAIDKQKEIEKAAKEEAARKAQEEVRSLFDAVKARPLAAMGKTAEQIRVLLDEAVNVRGEDPRIPDEMQRSAYRFERGVAIGAIKDALAAREAADAEAVKVAAEREELQKLRAEQEAVRAEAARQAKAEEDRIAAIERGRIAEEAAAKRQREVKEAAEKARVEAQERAEREAAAKVAREAEDAARAQRQAEQDEANRIERERLAAERRDIEEKERAAETKRLQAEQREVDNADLMDAGRELLAWVNSLGHERKLVVRKFAAALKRYQVTAAAA